MDYSVPEQVSASEQAAEGTCEADNASCQQQQETPYEGPVCLSDTSCYKNTQCGDSDCSCVGATIDDPDRGRGSSLGGISGAFGQGSCGISKRKRDVNGGVGEFEQPCLCNSTFLHGECCSGGQAIDGLLFF